MTQNKQEQPMLSEEEIKEIKKKQMRNFLNPLNERHEDSTRFPGCACTPTELCYLCKALIARDQHLKKQKGKLE